MKSEDINPAQALAMIRGFPFALVEREDVDVRLKAAAAIVKFA